MSKVLFAALLVMSLGVTLAAQDKGGSMMAASTTPQNGFYDVSKLGPSVVAYGGESAAMMAAKAGPTVYFFAASWCPTCQATYKDIVANFGMLPMKTQIVFVNYDTEKDLKSKYGVTYQHTFVQIDAMGKAVKTWSGTATVKDILKKISAR